MMRIDVISIFPQVLDSVVEVGVIGRGRSAGLLDIRLHDPRDATADVHRTVDDAPFGGGAGMVMAADPIFATVERENPPRPILLLGPAGKRFDQTMAADLALGDGFTLICGRYEGVDHRVRQHLCDDEISVGDYVLAGGEVAALAIIEAVGRLVPGVLGNEESTSDESFSAGDTGEAGLLEYPQYTRPADFRGWEVPEVLRSGDHGRVTRWRRAQALHRTAACRPDLVAERGGFSEEEKVLMAEFPPEGL